MASFARKPPLSLPVVNKEYRTRAVSPHLGKEQNISDFKSVITGTSTDHSVIHSSPLVTERRTIVRHTNPSKSGPCKCPPTEGTQPTIWSGNSHKMQDVKPVFSSNMLKIPFEGLLRGDLGASTASLVVHAPSLSRVSGQTDEDDEQAISDIIDTKFLPEAVSLTIDCPYCRTQKFGTNGDTVIISGPRRHSIPCINWDSTCKTVPSEQDEDLAEICTFHRTMGWNYGRATEGLFLKPLDRSHRSNSVPDFRLSELQLGLKETPTWKGQLRMADSRGFTTPQIEVSTPESPIGVDKQPLASVSRHTVNASRKKCESWLRQWTMN
ncbi:unnamed protein product [Calicophoron daubneyi]|uniref:Uncharacterized protein n=1 Tax=Calicophoron daubneyi TaxID=300641 RepID=A0AAV2TSY7_CALDB